MSTVKTTNLQHPSAPSPNLVLNADGSVTGIGLVAVKHALFTGTQSASVAGGSAVAVTDLSITHTLADSSNALIISAYLGAASTTRGLGAVGLAVADDGTLIGVGATAGNRISLGAGGWVVGSNDVADRIVTMPAVSFVYEPGDTASHTYTARAINIDSSTFTIYINRMESDTDATNRVRASSGLVIQEVKV